MLMAKLLQELQLHGKVKFDLVFLVMNPGYNEDNWNIILNNAKLLGIPINVFESDIFNIVADVDKSPLPYRLATPLYGSSSRTRTYDKSVNSRLLYQLSY